MTQDDENDPLAKFISRQIDLMEQELKARKVAEYEEEYTGNDSGNYQIH